MTTTSEICKTIIVLFLWTIPPVACVLFQNNWYLLLMLASMLGTITVFSHYEDMYRISQRGEAEDTQLTQN